MWDKNKLKIISLFIAILLFFSVSDNFKILSGEKSINQTTTWISDVPLEVNYNKEELYVVGVPDSVSVKLKGASSKVQKVAATKNIKAHLNLENLKIGDNQKVKIDVENVDQSIEATSDPEFITVSIKKRITKEFNVVPVVRNERLLLGYNVDSAVTEHKTVKISGAEESINNIYEVRAESNSKTKINRELKEEARLTAYDRNFNKIEDIDITPEKTIMTIKVTSIQKEIPISINKIGSLPSGVEIEKIEIEPAKSIIHAKDNKTLDNIKELFVDVDLNGITSSTERTNLKVYTKNYEDLISIETQIAKIKITIKNN